MLLRSTGNQVTREQCVHLFSFSLPGCKPLACGWQAQAGRRQRLGEETRYRKAEDREEKAVGETILCILNYHTRMLDSEEGKWGKDGLIWNTVLEECFTDALDRQEDEQVGPRAN